MRYEKYKETGISWLPEVPEGWEVRRLKHIVDSFRKGSGITKDEVFDDGDTPCVRYGEIYTKYNGSFFSCNSYTKKELLQNLQFFSRGDILFTCTGELVQEIGKNVVYLGDDKCLAGGDIIIASHNQDAIFLNYCLNSYQLQQQKSHGKAKLKVVHISLREIGNLLLPLPPLSEQRAIAEYLDDKCSKVDRLVEAKTKEVQLLKELRERVIADAVTGRGKREEFLTQRRKGAENVSGERKFKASGIPWLPEVPDGWEVKRARYLFKREQRPIRDNDEIVTAFRDGEVTLRKNRRTTGFTEATDYSHYQGIRKGDLVIHQMDAFAGCAGVSDSDGMGTPVLSVCTPKDSNVNVYYFAHIVRLMGHNGFIQSLARGIRERSTDFRFESFARQMLPLPPLSEQRAIVDYIEQRCAKIDALQKKLEDEVQRLKEFRERLVADVVTGQRKVV